MSFLVQAESFPTQRAVLDAVARLWIEADGPNDETAVMLALQDAKDDVLADRCAEAWGLARTDDDPRRSPLEAWGADEEDLAEAFFRYRVAYDEAHAPTAADLSAYYATLD